LTSAAMSNGGRDEAVFFKSATDDMIQPFYHNVPGSKKIAARRVFPPNDYRPLSSWPMRMATEIPASSMTDSLNRSCE